MKNFQLFAGLFFSLSVLSPSFAQAQSVGGSYDYKVKQAAEEYIEKADAAFKSGRYQESVSLLSEAIVIDPSNAQAYNNRGGVQFRLGNYKAALQDLDQTLAINPNDAQAYSSRGAIQERLGNNNAALADLNQAIAIKPDLASAYSNRGFVYDKLGDYRASIQNYNQALALNPNNADAYRKREAVQRKIVASGSYNSQFDPTAIYTQQYAERVALNGGESLYDVAMRGRISGRSVDEQLLVEKDAENQLLQKKISACMAKATYIEGLNPKTEKYKEFMRKCAN